jgi:hypothetical protein
VVVRANNFKIQPVAHAGLLLIGQFRSALARSPWSTLMVARDGIDAGARCNQPFICLMAFWEP